MRDYEVEAEKLAKQFGSKDPSGEWWGHDTTIGNPVRVIADALRQTAKEVYEVIGETSDGFHAFNELYEHRVLLWINLCLTQKDKCYVVENHYDGWFLLGMETEDGQISYHCPNKHLDFVSQIKRHHPDFDGHTSKQVIERLIAAALRKKAEGL